MAEVSTGFSSVSKMDKETFLPPPPKSRKMHAQNRRNRLIQNTLYLLVCIALGCIVVEAYFIYNLYKKSSESLLCSLQTDPQNAKKKPFSEKANLPSGLNLSKPLAHLTAKIRIPHDNGVMQWDVNFNFNIHELEYREGKLVVQKEGYYYIYSKISFSTDNNFIHSVKNSSPRYLGVPIELLRDRRYQQNPALKGSLRSSYLGGIFHLNKKDAVFVHVNDISLVRLQSSDDNFFGMFLL